MNTRLVVLSACISSLAAFASIASAAGPADAQWEELVGLMRGPKGRPNSPEEAREMVKKYSEEFDAKAEAFRKAYPNDPRRWKLVVQEIQANPMRASAGAKTRSKEEISKLADELLAAPDADKIVKATGNFHRLIAENDNAAFIKIALAHIKEFPDFPANKQIEAAIKAKERGLEVERELKVKPLELKFKATDGSEVDLEKLRGKVVLVDFWGAWCGPCVAEMPKIVASYEKLRAKGFEVIGISFDDDKSKFDTLVKDKGVKWPQYFDGKGFENQIAQTLGIDTIPRMWLVNKKGMVVDVNGREDLESKVEKLLAE